MAQAIGFVFGALGMTAGAAGAAAGTFAAGAALGAGAGILTQVAIRLATSVALSALSTALGPKPKKPTIPGLRTDATLSGGINPEGFVLGRFAVNGVLAAPWMSHGTAGKTPNAYLNYVIELQGVPGAELDGVLVNGEAVPILEDDPHPDYGRRLGGRFEGRAWVRYHDGSQTEADAMLLAKYPAPLARPWTSDMVGHGIAYVVLTCQYDREVFTAFPTAQWVLKGLRLYDPRKDSTAGGSGSQRWANPATWTFTENQAVMIYNVLRGITLPGGEVWGGGIPAEDLPFAVGAAAMDACDEPVDDGDGGTEPQFRAGREVFVDDEPFGVIEALLDTCCGKLAERGGVWTIRVGAPALPVLDFTDDDLLADAPDTYAPFPRLTEIYNAISATWTSEADAWQPRDAEALTNPAWEAEDDGRRLMASVELGPVTSGTQVQRLMAAMITDHRRMRVHQVVLPPVAIALDVLDTVAWTSASNGYTAKLFEVVRIERELQTGRVAVTLREIDPEDFEPAAVIPVAPVDSAPALPAAQGVPGWTVAPWTVKDAGSNDRRPALRCTWDADAADDARGLRIALRLNGAAGDGSEVAVADLRAGEYIVTEVLPDTAYQARARLVVDRPTAWSAWKGATTPDLRILEADLADATMGAIVDATSDALAVDYEAAQDAVTDAIAAARAAVVADGNPGFELGFDGWRSGEAVSAADLGAAQGAITGGGFESIAGLNPTAYQRRLRLLVPGRKYRIRTRFKVSGASAKVYVGYQAADGDGTPVGNSAGRTHPVVNGVVYPASADVIEAASAIFTLADVQAVASGDRSGAAGIYLLALLNYDATPGAQVWLDGIWLDDLTEPQQAYDYAQAAEADRIAAQTARGQAEGYRNTALGAADTASGAAGTATTQAGLSATASQAAIQAVLAAPTQPSTFAGGLQFFTTNRQSLPDAPSPAKLSVIEDDAIFGIAGKWLPNNTGDNVLTAGVFPWGGGRAYRVTAVFRVVAGGSLNLNLAGIALPLDYSAHTLMMSAGQSFADDGTEQTLTAVFSDTARAGVDVVNATTRPLARFGLRLNASGSGDVRIRQILVEDVTSIIDSAVSASAAYDSEQNAFAYAGDAGDYAGAANSAKLAAQTAKGLAEAAQGAAVSARDDAVIARNAAQTWSNVAARATGGGVSKNPVFNDWPTTYPANIQSAALTSGNAITKATSGVRYVNAARLVAGGVDDGPTLRLVKTTNGLDCSLSPGAVRVRAEVEYVSGTLTNGSSVRGVWTEGATSRLTHKLLSDLIDATPGIVQTVDVILERPAAAVPGSATNFAVNIYGSIGVGRAPLEILVHRLDFEEVLAGSFSSIVQQAVARQDGWAASVLALRTQAGSGGAKLELVALSDPEGDSSIARLAADDILLEGSVTVPYLTVDGLLQLSDSGAFSAFKVGPEDSADGLFVGKALDSGGAQRFVFSASREASGKVQSVSLTNDGFVLENSAFRVLSGAMEAEIVKTASMAVTNLRTSDGSLPTAFALTQAIGGGGGGGGGSFGSDVSGSAGAATVVELYDGAVLKRTFTASGGAGGAGRGGRHNDPIGGIDGYGAGGVGGGWIDDESRNQRGENGSGGKVITAAPVDLTGYANPRLKITIGSGGAGGGNGAAGAAGRVKYRVQKAASLEADVIPLKPKTTGNFAKTANTAGNFPDLGPGMWTIWKVASGVLQLEQIDLGDGTKINAYDNRAVTFVASGRPSYGATAGTFDIYFAHYPMGGKL